MCASNSTHVNVLPLTQPRVYLRVAIFFSSLFLFTFPIHRSRGLEKKPGNIENRKNPGKESLMLRLECEKREQLMMKRAGNLLARKGQSCEFRSIIARNLGSIFVALRNRVRGTGDTAKHVYCIPNLLHNSMEMMIAG